MTVCEQAHRGRDTASASRSSSLLNLTDVSCGDGVGEFHAVQWCDPDVDGEAIKLWGKCVPDCPSLFLSVVRLEQFPVKCFEMIVKHSSRGALLPLGLLSVIPPFSL